MTRKMKSSGIEWIGEIPEGWEIGKLKRFTTINSGEFLDKNEFVDNGNVKVIGANGKIGSYNKSNLNQSAIVTGRVGTIGTLYIEKNVWITDNVLAVHVIEGYLKFFYYYMHTLNFKEMSNTTAQPLITASKLSNINMAIPSVEEQRIISCFLDKKIKHIEEIKNSINKQIKALKNYKKSVITEAVTKSLDKNVEMKDSGIEWIGETPKHWKVIRIKNAALLKARIGWQGLRSDEFLTDSGLPYLVTGTDFNNGYVDWDNCVRISEKRFEMDKNIQIKENDLLITKDGTIGKLAIARNCPNKASLNSGVFVMRNQGPYKYMDKYMYYLLQSEQFYLWFELNDAGNSTIRHLYQKDFYNFSFTYPELKEQEKIVSYLDKKTKLIDDSTSLKRKQLETLEEYKKSLIYEYVTGKKEVTDGEEI